jgi:hypothetical protein
MFEQAELSGAAKLALIGQTVARELFGDMEPLDQPIRIGNVPFTIIGVLDKKGQSMMGQDQDGVIMVPLPTSRKRLFGSTQGKLRRVWTIQVKVREGASMKDAEEKIRELLRQRKRTQPEQNDLVTVRNLTEILQAQEASSRIMTLLLAAVASVPLLVDGIGIMNIMLVSVTERTREIGLRTRQGYPDAIPGRSRHALADRRLSRHCRWRRRVVPGSRVCRMGHQAVAGIDRAGGRVLRGDRHLFRFLSGTQGIAPVADSGITL